MRDREMLIQTMAKAIASHEGFYMTAAECRRTGNFKRLPDGKFDYRTVSARNNNPGNLRAWGRTPIVDGYASFPTVDAGWAALRRQVEKNVFDRKLSFREFFAGERTPDGKLTHRGAYPGFAPAADKNDATRYAIHVWEKVCAVFPCAERDGIDTDIHTLVEDGKSGV